MAYYLYRCKSLLYIREFFGNIATCSKRGRDRYKTLQATYSMRKLVLFILLLISVESVFAQNSSNYIQVQENAPWDFFMDQVYDLEHDMVIPNAFTIKVRTVSKAANIYARQQLLTYPSNFAPNGQGHLAIDFTSTNSTTYQNLVTNVLVITSSNQLIFRQNQMSSGMSVRTFNYDLVIIETGYDYFYPGYYTFRAFFTMTQP